MIASWHSQSSNAAMAFEANISLACVDGIVFDEGYAHFAICLVLGVVKIHGWSLTMKNTLDLVGRIVMLSI